MCQLLHHILAYSGLTPGFRQLLCYPLDTPPPTIVLCCTVDGQLDVLCEQKYHVRKPFRRCVTLFSRDMCHSMTLSEEGYLAKIIVKAKKKKKTLLPRFKEWLPLLAKRGITPTEVGFNGTFCP